MSWTTDGPAGGQDATGAMRAGKRPLRFIICGAGSAGKSTLIRTPCFATDRREFIVSEVAGPEYARKMVTAGSTADAAVILILPVTAYSRKPGSRFISSRCSESGRSYSRSTS